MNDVTCVSGNMFKYRTTFNDIRRARLPRRAVVWYLFMIYGASRMPLWVFAI